MRHDSMRIIDVFATSETLQLASPFKSGVGSSVAALETSLAGLFGGYAVTRWAWEHEGALISLAGVQGSRRFNHWRGPFLWVRASRRRQAMSSGHEQRS
jgi:hypothetical protein